MSQISNYMELPWWQFLNLKMSFRNLLKIFLKGLKPFRCCAESGGSHPWGPLSVSSFQVLTVSLSGTLCALFTCFTRGIKSISAWPVWLVQFIEFKYTWVSSKAFRLLSFRIALMFLLRVKGRHVCRVVCEGTIERSGHWLSAPFVQVPGIELRALGLTASALACWASHWPYFHFLEPQMTVVKANALG